MTNLTIDQAAKIHHATRAKAERLAEMFAAEYPSLQLEAAIDNETNKVAYWVVSLFDLDQDDYEQILSTDTADKPAQVPELADCLDAAAEMGYDPDADPKSEEEDEEDTGTVVDNHYRALYAEVSTTKRCCGDWLAEWLNGQCLGEKKRLDLDALMSIFGANGMDLTTPKWAQGAMTQTRGWQGRFRMSGRLVLERIVALQGFVYAGNGTKVTVPADEIQALRDKHAKYVAKMEKGSNQG